MGDTDSNVGTNPKPAEKYNVFAILALVFAFVFTPLGLIFGFVALSKIKKTGEKGKWMAWVGIIIGILVVVVFIGIGIVWSVVNNTMRSGASGIEAGIEGLSP